MGVFSTTQNSRKDNAVVDDFVPTDEPKTDAGFRNQETTSDSDVASADNLGRLEKEAQAHPDQITQDAGLGVQKAEAAALVWSKKTLYGIYAWIWVCYFMLSFHSSISSNLLYYAYSSYKSAPQISTASIMASIIGGVLRLPIGKMLTIWGRAEALFVFLFVYVIGMVIMAACDGPNSYAAGYVIYWIGYYAIYLILEIFVADTSGIRNRAFAFGFTNTPFICTSFTGPLAATSFIRTSGWRWGFGTFAIVMPFVFSPLGIVFKYYEVKARKMGLFNRKPSGRTTLQSVIHYIHEFDVIGALILMAAFVLFLLPFSLQQYGRTGYKSAAFIAPVVIGFCLFFVFAAWEKWFARVHFIPYHTLRDRTVLGACSLGAILFFSFYCWDLYFYYFCMVVYNLNTTMTGYMTSIYDVGSCIWAPIFGLYVRYAKEFKYSCLGFALPLMMLGAGLMIHFRGHDYSIGYVVMCQIFIAFSGGMLSIGEQMAVMCASRQGEIPLMLSMVNLFASVGGSIGTAVSAAIYSNTFPDGLRKALPDADKDEWNAIYKGGYLTQLTYPVGSDIRYAINFAYGNSQKYGAIAATAILVLAIPAIVSWRPYRVDRKVTKGTVL